MNGLLLLTALIGVDLAITDTASPRLAITESGPSIAASPENGRVLYLLSTDWCQHCPAAKVKAAQSGLPVQIIDGESSLAKSLWSKSGYNLSFPAWVLTVDGEPSGWWVGSTPRTSVRQMIEATPLPGARPAGVAPALAASVGFSDIPLNPGETLVAVDGKPVANLVERQPVKQTRASFPEGYHFHQCRNCGNEWGHTSGSHTCRNCGVVTTRIARWAN